MASSRGGIGFRLGRVERRGQFGAEIEQIVLDALQHGVERPILRFDGEARDADRRIGLVNGAIGFDANIVLAPARAIGERCSPGVPAARVDFVEPHHDA